MVAGVVGALVLWRTIVGRETDVAASVAAPQGSAYVSVPALRASRCEELSAAPLVLGEPPAVAKPAQADAAPPTEPEEIDDPMAPFAVEVGRGAAFDGGFVVGARRDEKGGALAMVATLKADGKGGEIVRLGRLRGDLDAPVVTGAGTSVIAVVAEPNAGGRAIKVAKISGTNVTWGAEFSEGRDESQALDVAVSGPRAVVVWDDLVGVTARHSNILLATLDVATMRVIASPHPVSAATEDAEHPRLLARSGGYWLAYVVRAPHPSRKSKDPNDEDDRELGEAITESFIELVPLDEAGVPVGAARAITPKNGYVLSYDLERGEDGGALVAWRDDDTPTGSSGGKLLTTWVRMGGVSEPRVLAEETKAAGVPDLFPGWISLPSNTGATLLAPLSPRGEVFDELAPERSLGAGVPIAAGHKVILWARPMGTSMRLSVVRCTAPVDAGTPP